MEIKFHPHALQRMVERGTKQNEVIATVQTGEPFPAKYGRHGFRKAFVYQEMSWPPFCRETDRSICR